MEILFRKYHTENADYLVLDPEHTKFDLLAQNIRIVCDRTKGLGADYLLCGPHYDGEHHNFDCFTAEGASAPVSEPLSRVISRFLQDTGHLLGMELDTEGVHFIGTMILGREFVNANGLQDQIPT